jgi:hypothetical protein
MEGQSMGTLVFECPSQGGDIRSGIRTDQASFERVKQLPVRVRCPICHQMHVLTAKHGHLEEGDD